MPAPRGRTVLLSVIGGVVVLAVAVTAWAMTRDDGDVTSAPSGSPSATAPTPSPSGPASAAPSASPAPGSSPAVPAEPGASAPAEGAPQDPAAPAAVDVVATFGAWNDATQAVEVAAYAAILEPEGTCTLTLDGPSGTQQQSRPAATDATSMSCGVLAIPRAELSPGTWQARVTYSSTTSQGTSDVLTVEVPR